MLHNARTSASHCRLRGGSVPSARPHSAAHHDRSSHAPSSCRQTYKLAIPERCSSSNNGDARSDDVTKSASPAASSLSSSRTSALEALRRTLRKHKSQRKSISTTGTSVVTVCNDDEEEEHEAAVLRRQQPDDDEEDIAILQPEEDAPASPEKRVHRWRRSISSMRMALSRSSSTSTSSSGSGSSSLRRRSKKASPTMYSISFYPWKRDPRAYYSNPEAAAEWVPDTASKRCQICLASFHLTRRRHHCRICGLLACNDCSLQRTYFPFTKGNRSQHHLIKDGAPQRTCNACAGTLKNMAAQHDPRVKQFTADAPVSDPFGMRDDGDDDDFSGATTAYDDASGTGEPETWRDDEIYVIDSGKSKSQHRMQLVLGSGASASAPQTQADELEEVLRARAQSRKNPQPKYYVVSSVWLEQWLQYVHIDASISSHGVPSRKHRAASTRRATPRNVRRPGPITNYALLNFVSGKLVPKDGLERSRGNDAGGDYRIVSEEVWSVFVRLYGGGPCIQLRIGDAASSEELQALVRTHSGRVKGTSAEPTDASHWVIVELDDSIPALIATEPADLLKGNRNMRRAASTSSLRHCPPSKSMKHLSSVHPFHETAPCVLGDVSEWLQQQQPPPSRAALQRHDTTPCILSDTGDRAQPYYPRDSIVNCITSPPAPTASRKTMRSTKRTQVQHQSVAPIDAVAQDRPLAAREWTNALLSGSAVHHGRRGSVGTVLFAPAQPPSSDSASTSEKVDASPRETIAAVSAFAVAAAEARKKSAMSLSRHSSTLSSSMIKSSAA